MSLLHKIQNQPREKKLRLVFIIMGFIALALVGVWVYTSRIKERLPKESKLYDTIKQGIKDTKEQYNSKPNQDNQDGNK